MNKAGDSHVAVMSKGPAVLVPFTMDAMHPRKHRVRLGRANGQSEGSEEHDERR